MERWREHFRQLDHREGGKTEGGVKQKERFVYNIKRVGTESMFVL